MRPLYRYQRDFNQYQYYDTYISITIGAIVGEIIDIDYKLNRFDTFIQQKVTYKDDKVRLSSASTTSNQYMR
ncbi:hypothetical protein J22TS1_14380 [Siminovitchia terrae]|nr:hypothetical protein [Siminovitchia terrae]GIN90387.1 hypothetical protein J22TS1_14380 [Siminovitchia terrae]